MLIIVIAGLVSPDVAVIHGLLDIRSAQTYTFKISRDAQIELAEGIKQSHIDRVAHSLKRHRQADAVRFFYDHAI